MSKKKTQRVTTALRYMAKMYRTFKGIGLPDEWAKSLAELSAIEREQNRAFIHLAWKIMEQILQKHNIDKIYYGQYYAFVNAYISKLQKGDTYGAEQQVKKFVERGLSPTIIREFIDRVGEVLSEPTEAP